MDLAFRSAALWPYAVLAALAAAMLAAILMLNGGTFTYGLDDAYIHLAFSEQLAQGHFGLVPGVPASPSSSILYPMLLMPLAGLDWHQFQPLAWNLAALLFTLALWQHLLQRWIVVDRPHLAGALALLVVLALNQIGLPFSGMEASPQIACSLAVAVGLIELLFAQRLRWWLAAGLLLGPVLRYENLSVTLPALILLAAYGRWRLSLLLGVTVAGLLGGYALYCTSLGLPPVPGSLLVKTSFDNPALDLWSGIAGSLDHLYRSMIGLRRDLPVLLLIALLAINLFRHRHRERALIGFALVVMLAQFVFGGHGSLGRYDSHAWSVGLAVALFIHRTRLRRWAQAPWRFVALLTVMLACLFPYTTAMAAVAPLASNNIYQQQYQMRRLLVDFVKAKALVNDAGLTAYRNPYGIVDVMGLGSEQIRRLRRDGRLDQEAVRQLTEDVVVAVFYYDWVRTRPSWWPYMAFTLRGPRISVAERQVLFYVVHGEGAKIQDAIKRFRETLPPGVSFGPLAPG